MSQPHFTAEVSLTLWHPTTHHPFPSFCTWIILQMEGGPRSWLFLCLSCSCRCPQHSAASSPHEQGRGSRLSPLLSMAFPSAFEASSLTRLNCTVILWSGSWCGHLCSDFISLQGQDVQVLFYFILFSTLAQDSFFTYCSRQWVSGMLQLWLSNMVKWKPGYFYSGSPRPGSGRRAVGQRWPCHWLQTSLSLCFRAGEGRFEKTWEEGRSLPTVWILPDARGKSLGIPWDRRSAWDVFKRRYLSTFHFNKEHLRRRHLGTMCSLQDWCR